MQIFEGQVRFGIHSGQQHASFDDYLELWKRAEDAGLDWASVFDHFLPIFSDPEGPCFDGLTLLGALAAHTSRIRCGVLVVGVTYRHPAVVANIATTIDHISGGRLELGMGGAWYELEHDQYGIPFPPTARRVGMLGEALKIVKSMWTQPRSTFAGRHFTLTDALCEPKPVQSPHPPLWVGGAGEKLTLRVVAESADGWNTFFMPLDEYRRKLDVLSAHCEAVGRDTGDIRKSLVVQAFVRRNESELREGAERLAARVAVPRSDGGFGEGVDMDALRGQALIGTPEQCVEQLMPYVEAGVGDFLIGARPPGTDMQTLELVAAEVAPAVKREAERLLRAARK